MTESSGTLEKPDASDNRALPYVPGLDGIRAFAVAAVLLYHGRVPWFPGGFLGVDVFFVLSGYLITSLLLAEYRRSGGVDLRRFWMGRARRLLPAAVTVIAVCLLIVAIFYTSDLGRLRGDALASLLYVNNWHQILAHHSYFAAFGRPSLLQHYWSLAVEEQFYLVWPILLIWALTRWGQRWVVAGTALLAAASAGLMVLLFNQGSDPSRVYYGTDTRATPLMVGALLAFAWPLGQMTARTGPRARTVLDCIGALGLGVLILAIVTWHDYDPFPYHGGFVIVALAAAAMIAVVSHPASRLSKGFAYRPLRWIGQRSYGIYLWHWPVMALTRPGIDLQWSLWILVPLQIAITLLLATASYRYIEMPVRRRVAWEKVRAWFDQRRPRERLAAATTTGVSLILLIVTLGFLPLTTSSAAHPLLRSAAAAASVTKLADGKSQPGTATTSAGTAAGTVTADGLSLGGWRPTPGSVLAVGASVMLAAQPALEQRLGARVDAAVGRQPSAIIARLQAYRDAGALPQNVVVQVGDNGPLWSADAAQLRAVLSGVRHVVLVNIREPSVSWEGEVNDELAQTVRSWPGATIADWLSASGNGALLYDGVHPDPAGQQVYAAAVAHALAGDVGQGG